MFDYNKQEFLFRGRISRIAHARPRVKLSGIKTAFFFFFHFKKRKNSVTERLNIENLFFDTISSRNARTHNKKNRKVKKKKKRRGE